MPSLSLTLASLPLLPSLTHSLPIPRSLIPLPVFCARLSSPVSFPFSHPLPLPLILCLPPSLPTSLSPFSPPSLSPSSAPSPLLSFSPFLILRLPPSLSPSLPPSLSILQSLPSCPPSQVHNTCTYYEHSYNPVTLFVFHGRTYHWKNIITKCQNNARSKQRHEV